MEVWQKRLKEALTSPGELASRFDIDPSALEAVVERYPMRITPHYLGLIQSVGDPIWKQCVPDVEELREDLLLDPLGEEDRSPVSTLVHRYPDRALLLASGSCAVYCRFCTRKRKVGCAAMKHTFGEVLAGIDYIAKTKEIRDVLLSGGDPLMLPDRLLGDILQRLSAIEHVDVIRIGTRVPVTLPERITESLCDILRRFHPLYINTHFNHPREITPASAQACAMLADAGIPLGNQTVLLKGVNDDAAVMHRLFRALLKIRVKPYYMHHMDLARGTGHFRTRVDVGMAIMESLRGNISGPAIPHYVIDTPGGKGKVPILPEYIESLGDTLILRTHKGERLEFPNNP